MFVKEKAVIMKPHDQGKKAKGGVSITCGNMANKK